MNNDIFVTEDVMQFIYYCDGKWNYPITGGDKLLGTKFGNENIDKFRKVLNEVTIILNKYDIEGKMSMDDVKNIVKKYLKS